MRLYVPLVLFYFVWYGHYKLVWRFECEEAFTFHLEISYFSFSGGEIMVRQIFSFFCCGIISLIYELSLSSTL